MTKSPGHRAHVAAQPASSRLLTRGLCTPAEADGYLLALTADLMAGVLTFADAEAWMREARKILGDADTLQGD
jgi:hypothetical protein